MTLGGRPKFWGNSYSYDAWGNLLQKTPTQGHCSGENLSVTVGVNNQLQGAYTYDDAGNMIHDATANLDYRYDPENRIMGAGGFTYTYDADGNRVEKANGTTGTLYWYMTLGIVAESDLTGNLKNEYVFFDGQRVARKDFPGNAVSYYFSDHLKTASVITDSAGNIKSDSDYYPWGGEVQFTNNDSNHYKFTGKERDSETGLDLMGHRYYVSAVGRFMTTDPKIISKQRMADPQQWNMYAYVRNNPLLFVDPDGKELTLYLYNNTGGLLSNQQLAQAGTGIANKFHDAGVKNVSYRVVDRVPVNLKHDGHSRFIEVTNGRDGKYWSLDKGTAGENPVGSNFNRARTYVQVDANASIRNQTPTTADQRVNNLIEVGSHESAHGVLGHSDDPNNIMNSPWGSNRPFDTQQSQQLQSGFNRPGEVDSGVSCGQQSLACAGNSTPNSMPTPPTTPLSKPESNTSN